MMLRCTFCNKVFQGTQFQATRHFSQTNYFKDVSDEALYEIARRSQQKFEADQMERVARYAAERGLDVPDTGGAREGESGQHPVEGGVGGDGGQGAPDPTLGGGGGETKEGVIHVDREARGPGEEGVPEREDMQEFYPGTGERLEDWRRRVGKGAATEGSSKRKEGRSDPAATPAGKRLRQQKVTDVYGGEWVARHKKAFLRWLYSSWVSFNAFRNQAWKAYQQVFLEQSGSSPRSVLPNHSEIVSMRAVETHRVELAEELEEVRQPFWVTGATLLSDGRKSRDGRPIVNFLAAGSRGAVVYTTINREWDPWWQRVATIVHIMQPVMDLLRRMDRGGQYMSLMIEWTQDLVRRVTDACAPLGKSFADWIIRRVQARTQHMLEPAHCAEFLLNPRRRHVRYFSGQVDRYDAWLVGQAKRYIMTQTGFKLEGAEYILACRQFEDFHIQQGRFGDWGGPEGRARGGACSGDNETIEYASWWSLFRGITEEEIARQVALITRDPIGASVPPSADAVFDIRACIFRPYPREDDSYEEPVPEAAEDPALRIPREIDETHEDPDSAETRAHTARRAADRAEREMLGGEEEFWGPFGELPSTGGLEAQATTPTLTRRKSSMSPPPAPSPAPPSPVSPLQLATATADREELGSSLPQRGLLHRGGAVRQLRLRSPSPGILQEEGALSTAAVESSVAPAAVPDATILAAVEEIAAAAAVAAEVEGQVAAEGGAGGGAAAVEEEEAPSAAAVEGEVPRPVEEEIAAQAKVQRGGDDERLMQQFLTEELDPVIEGMTPGVARGFGISDSEMGTHLDLDLSMGLPPSCGGATSTDRAPSRDDAPGQTSTQTARERTTTESPDAASDIMERERARLLASSDPRAQSFARAVEEARRREIEGDCVQGGVVAGEDVAEGVAAEPLPKAMSGVAEAADVAVEGRPQAVDEVVQAGQRRIEGGIDARREVQETATSFKKRVSLMLICS
ncbi:hypothetical protein CBR_g50758 [Chara braunii]|uniref:DUF659 domain-containing protein n=1 Tax=Chara braunii TaxID=69332 RepID=A0A388K5S2_CHABU|nr:hypothetical protein CBR_g50758 [Chara braunii]|eukprot:GBG65397.1 hypothetical protein CBR_g50758 [Chara braunii]